ncbi:MAG: hydroxymethylbilane synthase, partial [Acidimicrobiia bacterium]
VLEPVVLLPQVGLGALAVECRADDDTTAARLAPLEDRDSRRCVDAERAFLVELGGDCDLPAGALARPLPPPDGRDGLELRGLLASLDGHVVLRHEAQGTDPAALGQAVARHLLDRAGGRSLLLR